MPRFRRRRLLIGFLAVCGVVILASTIFASAQAPPAGWFGDEEHLHARILVNGVSITATDQANPIPIDVEGDTTIYIEIDVIGTQAIHHLRGAIGFWYQSIKVFEITVAQNESSALMQPDATIPPVQATLPMGDIVTTQLAGISIDVITGMFEASVSLYYLLEGEVDGVDTPHSIEQVFFLTLPPSSAIDAITSIAGIATTVATGGAILGVGASFKSLLEGVQTAHKVRSIQKKAGEIKSLPNLTVLGALPALFSLLSMQVKIRKKKATEDEIRTYERGEGGVSEYRIRQRVREIAPEAWAKDKCPNCRTKWRTDAAECKKCHIDIEEAQEKYADVIASKVPIALQVMGKKKSLSIRKLAKRTKSNEYNAGVLGAALVDSEVTEIQKIETPVRSFVMNIGGLAFLILTWQTLLGGSASTFQTTLTVVGGALSLAVIVALYFSRRSQIQKLQVTLDDQDIAVAEEAKSEPAVEPVGAEAEPREEEYVAEEASDIDEEYSESETDEESIYITDEEYSEDDEA
ncbi:MAG: hypothetical protein ACFFAD_12695 [Candidatus Hermodarchaeota archaeon]